MLIIWPIFYGVLYGSVYSKGKLIELPIIVVDQDNTATSADLIDMLEQTELLRIKEIKPEAVGINKTFIGEAAYAVVDIPVDFEAKVMQGKSPEVNTYINNVNLLPSGYVNRTIASVVATLNAKKTSAMGLPLAALHLNTYRLFNPSGTYFLFAWPSYLFLVLEAVVMVVFALSFAAEQENGTLGSLYLQAGNSVPLMLAGKLIPYLLLSLVSMLVYIIYFYLFRQPYPTHVLALLWSNAIFVIACALIGIIVGTLVKEQLKSLQALMILSMPIYIASGFSWPYDQQGGQLAQWFSKLFPYMPSVNALHILLIEQGGFADIQKYLKMQYIQVLVYFILAIVTIRLLVQSVTTQTKSLN
ncbi:ABC transporter permease [Sphingobacterium sp.]|uniref:ABC transporter permease n=1 Tax=Sphingobacterium sp. TaxID=341027 RepID=UPI0031E196AF